MRFFTFTLGLIFSANAVAGTKFSEGQATISKALELRDSKTGQVVSIVSGAAALEVDNKGLLWGDGSIKITTAKGSVQIAIPRANFGSQSEFLAPANDIKQDVSLKGTRSKRIEKSNLREAVVACNFPGVDLPVMLNNGQRAMVEEDGRQRQLVIRVCAQTVDGKPRVRQIRRFGECRGTQKVEMETVKTTLVYNLEMLDPATGSSLGKIEASGMTYSLDEVARTLSICE